MQSLESGLKFSYINIFAYDFTYELTVFVTACKARGSPRKSKSQHGEKWAPSPTSNGGAIGNC